MNSIQVAITNAQANEIEKLRNLLNEAQAIAAARQDIIDAQAASRERQISYAKHLEKRVREQAAEIEKLNAKNKPAFWEIKALVHVGNRNQLDRYPAMGGSRHISYQSLMEAELIEFSPYGGVQLTEKGAECYRQFIDQGWVA